MAGHYRQGIFTPTNKEKYRGDANRIVYRSGWELKLFRYLDQHPDVLIWASEEPFFCVRYRHPITGTIRRYFPDVWIRTRDKDGNITTRVIEVKPAKETVAPKGMSANRKRKLTRSQEYAMVTYLVNEAKWQTAHKYFAAKGWAFQLITEKELNV